MKSRGLAVAKYEKDLMSAMANPRERHVTRDSQRFQSSHNGVHAIQHLTQTFDSILGPTTSEHENIDADLLTSIVSNMMNKLSGQPDSYDKKSVSLHQPLPDYAHHD